MFTLLLNSYYTVYMYLYIRAPTQNTRKRYTHYPRTAGLHVGNPS